MDEAFLPLHELLPTLLPLTEPLGSEESGVLTTVIGCEVETPVELDIVVRGHHVEIGGTPPLYHLETSLQPVLHALRVVIVSKESVDE